MLSTTTSLANKVSRKIASTLQTPGNQMGFNFLIVEIFQVSESIFTRRVKFYILQDQ
jgi:hypothetical protein